MLYQAPLKNKLYCVVFGHKMQIESVICMRFDAGSFTISQYVYNMPNTIINYSPSDIFNIIMWRKKCAFICVYAQSHSFVNISKR